MPEKRYLTNADLHNHLQRIIKQMSDDNWKPELIIGITRGGAIPAVMLSHYFNCKMVGLDVSLRDDTEDYGPETNCWAAEDAINGKRTLIVDDINDSGATINWIVNDWGDEVKWQDTVRFAVLVDNLASKASPPPNYFGEEINKVEKDEWIVFPWENFWEAN
jgi:hypoxanthine phosphoribosyltransferase